MSGRKIRITAALGLILGAALAGPAFGESFVGAWTATAVSPGGEVSETLTVAKTDGTAELGGVQVPYNGVRIHDGA